MPTSGPVVLESTHYPYALTLPAERLFAPFKPARQPWDGESRIVRGAAPVDEISLSGGALFLVGIPWDRDLPSLVEMFVEHGARFNGCGEAEDQRDTTIGGAAALVFTVGGCGSQDLAFARAAVVHDGFGLIAFTETSAGREGIAVDRLLSGVATLEWRDRR